MTLGLKIENKVERAKVLAAERGRVLYVCTVDNPEMTDRNVVIYEQDRVDDGEFDAFRGIVEVEVHPSGETM